MIYIFLIDLPTLDWHQLLSQVLLVAEIWFCALTNLRAVRANLKRDKKNNVEVTKCHPRSRHINLISYVWEFPVFKLFKQNVPLRYANGIKCSSGLFRFFILSYATSGSVRKYTI